MGDIVGRLRAWADPVEQGYEVPAAGQVMRSAADEIEHLRKEVSRLQSESWRERELLRAKGARQDARIDRLREALRAIADQNCLTQTHDIAKEALDD